MRSSIAVVPVLAASAAASQILNPLVSSAVSLARRQPGVCANECAAPSKQILTCGPSLQELDPACACSSTMVQLFLACGKCAQATGDAAKESQFQSAWSAYAQGCSELGHPVPDLPGATVSASAVSAAPTPTDTDTNTAFSLRIGPGAQTSNTPATASTTTAAVSTQSFTHSATASTTPARNASVGRSIAGSGLVISLGLAVVALL